MARWAARDTESLFGPMMMEVLGARKESPPALGRWPLLGLLNRWPPTRISEAWLSVMLAQGRGPRYGGGLLRSAFRVQPEQCRWRSGDI